MLGVLEREGMYLSLILLCAFLCVSSILLATSGTNSELYACVYLTIKLNSFRENTLDSVVTICVCTFRF